MFDGNSGIAEEDDSGARYGQAEAGDSGGTRPETPMRNMTRMKTEPATLGRWPSLRTLLPSAVAALGAPPAGRAEGRLFRQNTDGHLDEGGKMGHVRSVGSRGSTLILALKELATQQEGASQIIQDGVDGASRDTSAMVRDLIAQVQNYAVELDSLGPTLKQRSTEVVPLIENVGKQVDLLRVQDAHVRLRTAKEHLDTSDMLAAARAREFKHLVTGMTEGLQTQSGPTTAMTVLSNHGPALESCKSKLDVCCREVAALHGLASAPAHLSEAIRHAAEAVKASASTLASIHRSREEAISIRRSSRTQIIKSLPAWQEAIAAHKRNVTMLTDIIAGTGASMQASQEQVLANHKLLNQLIAQATATADQTQATRANIELVQKAVMVSKKIDSLRTELSQAKAQDKEALKEQQAVQKQLKEEKKELQYEISRLTLVEHMQLPALQAMRLPRPKLRLNACTAARRLITVTFLAALMVFGIGLLLPPTGDTFCQVRRPHPYLRERGGHPQYRRQPVLLKFTTADAR